MSFEMSEYKKPYINLCPMPDVPFFVLARLRLRLRSRCLRLGAKTLGAPLQLSPTFLSAFSPVSRIFS